MLSGYCCYCFADADFDQFKKECVSLKGGWNDIFIKISTIYDAFRPIQVTYIACCKKFVDFQIDLLIKTESFSLRTNDCRYNETWTDVDFDCDDNDFLEIYYNSDDDSDDSDNDDNSSNKEETNPFTSSVCYTEMRCNLKFQRFCLTCQDVFNMYFTKKLHIL